MGVVELLSTNMPPAVSVGAAAVSVLAAIGTAVLSYLKGWSLERAKAGYQKDIEARKAEYQQDIENRKAGYQADLERRKSELQTELEGRKSELQKDLEEFKAGLADELAAQNARRSYEYDAKKRLYAQVEPLLFQLFEAAEGAFHAVASLARTQRMGKLPAWLAADAHKYYIRSIIHRLFLPLAIFRLIRQSTTLVDLNLDPSIRLRYALLKEGYLTWTDDFGIADCAPKLDYRPNEDDWARLRKANQPVYWRQGLVIGSVDRLVDAMTSANSAPPRPMNFGEWELAVTKTRALKLAYEIVEDIFIDFEFRARPVLGRLLISYACMMHTLMSIYGKPVEQLDLTALVSGLSASGEVADLKWRPADEPHDDIAEILPYVLRRCTQATRGEYVKF
jgi:hypothetical protein